jgi:radical SAM superfamily enzyme with C-terminal helix-hairpin-helix motif
MTTNPEELARQLNVWASKGYFVVCHIPNYDFLILENRFEEAKAQEAKAEESFTPEPEVKTVKKKSKKED